MAKQDRFFRTMIKSNYYIMKPMTPATKCLQPNYIQGTLKKSQLYWSDSLIFNSH